MKRSSLILLSILAFQSIECFRQHAPPHPPMRRDSDSSASSMSSEEDSFEDAVLNKNQRKRIDPDRIIQLQQKQTNEHSPNIFEDKKKQFFDRPSSEELEAYDEKVKNQKNNRIIDDEPVMIQGPMDPIREPKPMKPKMDDADEKLFLAALGQIYLDKLDESREMDRFAGPPGPIGPMGPPPPMDYDYFFVPMDTPGKKEANNNGNNNVHVNVNHVQVNSNVLHVPEKDKKPKDHEEIAPIVPAYHYSEPVSSSRYFYLNFNMIDCAILAVLVVAFLFATKKAYKKCFPKKVVAPQLPTSLPPTALPPTYSPHLVVESVSKKTPQ